MRGFEIETRYVGVRNQQLLDTMLLSKLKKPLFLGVLLIFSITPASGQIVGGPQEDDHFGNAVATGDFDNDGYMDLAIGVPGDVTGANEAGGVNVIYGTADGLSVADNQRWAQGVAGILGAAEDFDWFGYSVTSGDFNGDGYDDLAVGVPYEDVSAVGNAGAVNIIYGSTSGLQTAFNQIWVQGDFTLTTDEADDRWGWDVAAGDFDNDGYDDLAVSTPWEEIGGTAEGGVTIIHGTNTGLVAADAQFWTILSSGASGTTNDFDSFGWSVATGDFDDDGYSDLAIGVIGDDEGATNSGSVAVMYGTNTGLTSVSTQLWSQNAAGISGAPELGDQFGYDVATGDFDNDGYADLAVGVPYEDDGSISNSGAINVIFGSAAGLTSTGNQLFSQADPEIALAVEEDDNFGFSIATGHFGGDQYEDIAIGIRGEDVGSITDAGAILVMQGSASGIFPGGAQYNYHQDNPNIEGDADEGDLFGHALATGDFDNDGFVDVAVGVPNEEINGALEAGAVNVLYNVFSTTLPASDYWYQSAMPVANEPESPGVPTEFSLQPAYPNPFNPSTTIQYNVAEAGAVRIAVYDALGRQVTILADDQHTPGHHEVVFDAQGLASGVYLVRMEAGSTVQTQRITLQK